MSTKKPTIKAWQAIEQAQRNYLNAYPSEAKDVDGAAIIARHAPQPAPDVAALTPETAGLREAFFEKHLRRLAKAYRIIGGDDFKFYDVADALEAVLSEAPPAPATNADGRDSERLDWLEKYLLSLSKFTGVDMGGWTHRLLYRNPAKELGAAGPSYLNMSGRSVRDAIDRAARTRTEGAAK